MRRLVPTLLAAALILPLGGCGGGGASPIERLAAERRAQAEQVARDAKLSEDVQDFLGDAAEAVAGTFTVTYREDDKTTTLAQRPPDRRVDVVSGGVTEAVFRRRDGTVACTRNEGKPWECTRAAGTAAADPDLGVFSEQRLADTAKALGDARTSYAFEIVNRRIAGASARCLVTTPKLGDPAHSDELCIAPTGAIVRIRSGGHTLEAERYQATVPEDLFELPAAPR